MMRRFRGGEVHVLVATTVIEVGIDVPERHDHADRASRAVRAGAAAPAPRAGSGAGHEESYCILMADAERAGPAARVRRPRRTGSGSRSWTWRSAGWAT